MLKSRWKKGKGKGKGMEDFIFLPGLGKGEGLIFFPKGKGSELEGELKRKGKGLIFFPEKMEGEGIIK